MPPQHRIAVENINHPGTERQVDRAMYDAMRQAYLRVLPSKLPGLTLAQISERLAGELPQQLFPGGARAGWWAKTVQLDLEAKGLVKRNRASPIRLYRSSIFDQCMEIMPSTARHSRGSMRR